jgi:protein-tyrosine phosphatase
MSRSDQAPYAVRAIVVALTLGLSLSISVSRADDPRAATAIPAQAAIDRVLPLEGGVNFRELGGYPTVDGRRVRRGMLYRSGAMASLTDADYELLSKLDIAVLVDLRSTDERSREPTRWPLAKEPPRRLERDYDLEFGEVLALMRGAPNAETARTAFASFYRRLPQQFADQYRQMFAELLSGNAPLAFNCSAGKDRTGVASALILTALGVPREVVMEDYLLSNRHYKPKPMSASAADDPTVQFFSRLPPDVVQVFMGVDASFLEAAFDGMTEQYGSVDGYLEKAIGLTAEDRKKLRRIYTEVDAR